MITARPSVLFRLPLSALFTVLLAVLLAGLIAARPSHAASGGSDGGVTYRDIATDPTSGLAYARAPSPRDAIFEALKAQPLYTFPDDVVASPFKPRGVPGVVIFDFDGDGDEDLYVTNGPGTANSLFRNLRLETGVTAFEDVAVAAGVDATDQDSNGAVAGDLDNDGDADLYVLGSGEPNRLFENLGDGTFADRTASSGTGAGALDAHTSATLGDIDGDGLLDIIAGGATDFDNQIAIFFPFPANNIANSLFRNRGDLTFEDVSESSGLRRHAGVLPMFAASPTLTHVIAAVDIDQDGDTDIISGDDQATVPSAAVGGVDYGLIHVFENDGTGNLTDRNVEAGLAVAGAWMGLTFGDYDHNGHLDLFASNFGSYATQLFPLLLPTPDYYASRWYLQDTRGTFSAPGVGDVVATPFGWGASSADLDNDGDTDLIFHGGLDVGPLVVADNPGMVLLNDGSAGFRYDGDALAGSTDHSRRIVHGFAAGDLDLDGFPDLVSVSNFDIPAGIPLPLMPPLGGPADATAFLVPTFIPTADPNAFVFNHQLPPLPDGSLSVELSSGNDNGWVAFRAVGSVNLTARGRVNRDGIGAVVRFTPHGGDAALRPIVAGSSYASQDSLIAGFGLGDAHHGTVEVLWPGGVRNRLYGVRHGERLDLPEIPVSIDADLSFGRYVSRVRSALRDLQRAGVIDRHETRRFFFSALLAFLDERG